MSAITGGARRVTLGARLRLHWLLKFLLISLCITLFMVGYFLLLRHPLFAVTEVPRLALDDAIPFVPLALVPYASLWAYIGFAPAMLHDQTELRAYLGSAVLLGAIGYAAFLFFPTAVPASAIDWSPWPLLAWLKSADAAGNACPSLHVAYAVFTSFWLGAIFRDAAAPRWLHAGSLLWCLLIVWSTLAIRQHVLLDVLAGAVLGVLAARIGLPWSGLRARRSCAGAC